MGSITFDGDVGITSSTSTSLDLTRRRQRLVRLREQSLRESSQSFMESHGQNLNSLRSMTLDGSQSPPLRHNGFQGVSKRREANARERLRVRNLNSGFAKLRRILPTVPPNRKPSKVDTLQGAIDYIHQLEQLLEATGGIPDIGNCSAGNNHPHSRQSVTESPFFPVTDLNPVISSRLSHRRKRFALNTEEDTSITDEKLSETTAENVSLHRYFPYVPESAPHCKENRDYAEQTAENGNVANGEFYHSESTAEPSVYFPTSLPSWEFSPLYKYSSSDPSPLCGAIETTAQQNPITV